MIEGMNTMQIKRILSSILLPALCLTMTACAAGGETAAAPTPPPAAIETPIPAAESTDRTGRADPEAADKEETVYVQADPDGSVRKVTVETVLNYGGDGGPIVDETNLKDIKNTEGDEEFTLKRNGSLTWEDHGERVRYEGVGTGDLPVTVRLTYWLDGEEMDPAELAGRSGHVRIRFDYENRTSETVTVTHADLSDEDDGDPAPPETEEVQTPIPFLAVSLVLLPEDVFRSVTVENGRLMTLGDDLVVLGCAFPGLGEALDLTACELTEDVDIPEYVEFEADVTDFSLDFTATIFSNGLLEDLEPEDLNDAEKLIDGMDKLTDATEQLVDGAGELAEGAGELSDGAGEFSDYIAQYVSGVSQLGDGADGLRDGISAISAQTGPLREGAAAAADQLTQLQDSLDGMDIPEMESTAAALEAVIASVDSLQAALGALQDYPAAVESAVGAADSLLAGVDLDVSSALWGLDLTDEQRQAVQDAVAAELSGASGSISAARGYLEQLSGTETDLTFSADMETISLAASQLRDMAEQALDNLDELPASPNEALGQLVELASGVTALCDGIDQLSEGSAALADGVSALAESGAALQQAGVTLADGTATLADGADALSDGIKEFDEEGIAELTDLANDDLAGLITRIRALREADIGYDNYGGLAEGRTGSVRFIVETDSIG